MRACCFRLRLRRHGSAGALLALLLLAAPAQGREGDLDDLLDVSYIHAAIFGTGTYALNNRRVTMLKIPFAWTQRPATPESVGWRWLAPVVLGSDDLSQLDSDIIEALLPDQLVTLSAMPGVEFIYPVNDSWYLKPFLEIGGGRDFSAEENFALTQLGVRSLSRWDLNERWAFRLGAALRWAGEYQFHSEDRTAFGIVDIGSDIRRSVPWRIFDQPANVGAYYLYQRFLPRWTFGEADDWEGRAIELHEFGLSLGVERGRRMLGIPVKRVRVGCKKGGQLQGWTIGTEFPF